MRQHGTHACYMWGPEPGCVPGRGCRCEPCRAAAAAYNRSLRQRIAPPYVDATEVREHLAMLSKAGVGLKQVTRLTGITGGALNKIMYGTPRADGTRRPPARRVRPETRDKIMAVMPTDAADGAPVDAGPVWRDVAELRRRGWTKAAIARAIGQRGPGLQLGSRFITAGNARAIRALLAEPVPPRRSRHGEHPVPQPDPEPPRLRSAGESSIALLLGGHEDVPARVLAEGACRVSNVPSWLFFPDVRDRATIAAAKAVCRSCPVQAECLAHAVANPEVGVWGGTTEAERRAMGAAAARPVRVEDLEPCGTTAAYRRHLRAGEPACDACRAANAEACRAQRVRAS